MKDTIIILAIILLIVGGDILTRRFLNQKSEELIQSLEDLKEDVIMAKETKQREQIKKQMNEVEEKWNEISNMWSIIVMHQEIDNIEQALTKAKSNINDGELEDAIPEIETAIFFAEHVKAREELNLKNIF